LVGISPKNNVAWADKYFYVPDYTQSPPTWKKKTVSDTGWNTENDIPSHDGTTTVEGEGTYGFTGITTATDYQAMKGDICRYLNENYRMPTDMEFLEGRMNGVSTIQYSADNWTSSTPITDGWWSRIGGDLWNGFHYPADDAGKEVMSNIGGNYSNYTRFPAWYSQSINFYWTATGMTPDGGYLMIIHPSYRMITSGARFSMMPIRCILNYDNRY
jgi:hypothetical protein